MDSTKLVQDHEREEDGQYHSESDKYPSDPPNQLKQVLKQFNPYPNNKIY